MPNSLFQHAGVGMLRAAAAGYIDKPTIWPDLTDPASCRSWIHSRWGQQEWSKAIQRANPALARRLDTIQMRILLPEKQLPDKEVLGAAKSLVRYALRATGRHTPFGLFAGVGLATITESTTHLHWGERDRVVARVDSDWLSTVIDELERDPEFLPLLKVVVNNLTVRRGLRIDVPYGPHRVSLRCTKPVDAVLETAADPILFADLAMELGDTFPVPEEQITTLLTDLVMQGVLITNLRAPSTEVDPLSYLVDALDYHSIGEIPFVTGIHTGLRNVRDRIAEHNSQSGDADRAYLQAVNAMRALPVQATAKMSVDLRLDAHAQLPRHLARDLEAGASALARLSRQPTGHPVWRDWYMRFVERYGTNLPVPLLDAVNPDSGLGYPAGYPGSVLPAPEEAVSERDVKLLAYAWHTIATGDELVLDDTLIDQLRVGDPHTPLRVPPHVEIGATIHASSPLGIDDGDYLCSVAPGRAAGTFTARLADLTDNGLDRLYASLPTCTRGASPVQLSCPPAYAHAQNISRTPQFLPHVLSLGEHRAPATAAVIPLDDLAVLATGDGGLCLLSRSRQKVLEPQAFNALAFDKQYAALARFLVHLPRAGHTVWHRFDWGPIAGTVPFLPRVRYGRTILSHARWRLSRSNIPLENPRLGLERWRIRYACPKRVELTDHDRTLRLDLDDPAHRQLLLDHLDRHGEAVLTEIVEHWSRRSDWIGHAHEVVFPLITTQDPVPTPTGVTRPAVTISRGDLPGRGDWLYAKLYTHPDRIDELITVLDDELGDESWWVVRYRSNSELDHLRLRIATNTPGHRTDVFTGLGQWAQRLRAKRDINRLVLDTYQPETGRYWHMPTAETVFTADTTVTALHLRTPGQLPRDGLVALNMIGIAVGMLGSHAEAMRWFINRPAHPGPPVDRALLAQVTALVATSPPEDTPGWSPELDTAWRARADALATYRNHIPDSGRDAVIESLLHMHHNRLVGIDRDREHSARKLARHAALTWQHRTGATT
ncbi:lantibiotic dehydratase [Sciscionella marina]|uniref:lantibiotic dehydratase n=1 Tax=Sciscionella marina TaxID=508770 RepID=UPI0003A2878D|nr:lantibiotic dehydratase [Sciscionella marina]